jgi:hypothetical protein
LDFLFTGDYHQQSQYSLNPKHYKEKESEPEGEKSEAMLKVDTNYEWISGEPLVDKKSTFQASICAN